MTKPSFHHSSNRHAPVLVHVLKGDCHFLSLAIIEFHLRNPDFPYYFVVVREEAMDAEAYRALFARYGHSDFEIVDEIPSKTSLFFRVFQWVSTRKWGSREMRGFARITAFESRLLDALLRHRHRPILLHGTDFNWRRCFLLTLGLFSSLSWVCWGNVPRFAAPRTVMERLRQAWIRAGFRRLRRIVCLMEPDARAFESWLGSTNIVTASYPQDYLGYADPTALDDRPLTPPIRVLLGNSAHSLPDYWDALRVLAPLAGRIELTAMLNYGREGREEEVSRFEKEAVRLFPSAFHPWREVEPIDRYMQILKTHDIYICPTPTQSGLHALYSMLMFGKKAYLRGANLAWARTLGFRVFDFDDLKADASSESIAVPLPGEEKRANFSVVQKRFDPAVLRARWKSLYEKMVC